jgi:hypothetical protein
MHLFSFQEDEQQQTAKVTAENGNGMLTPNYNHANKVSLHMVLEGICFPRLQQHLFLFELSLILPYGTMLFILPGMCS